MRTTVTFEGNLAADPELRYTASGKQVVEFTVLVNERRLNTDTGEWEDGEPTRHRVKAFKQLGENIAESLRKGDRVFVHGTITTEVWTDKDTGDKRTAQKVLADIVWTLPPLGHRPHHQGRPRPGRGNRRSAGRGRLTPNSGGRESARRHLRAPSIRHKSRELAQCPSPSTPRTAYGLFPNWFSERYDTRNVNVGV